MKPARQTLALVALAAALAACGPRDATPPDSQAPAPSPEPATTASLPAPDLRQVGTQIVAQAFGILSSNLTAAIARSGPAGALEFCSVNVAPLTASVAGARNVELRRVSHKARNEANRASTEELRILEQFRAALPGSAAPVLVTNAAGRVTFYAPILLANPLCLQCHGEPGKDIAAATVAAVDRLYPQDAARGFQLGDLRGMWVVSW